MSIYLESQRLHITTATYRMAGSILEFYIRNTRHLSEWEDVKDSGFYTLAQQRANIRAENARLRNATGIDLWLTDKQTGEICGKVAVFGIISGNFALCVIGYKLDEEHVGKGLMTEALRRIEEFLFDELHLRRIEINIMPRNSRSIAVVTRLGYQLECEIKEYIRINGVWEDHLRYVKVNEGYRD